MSDDEFLAQFENRSLPIDSFRHADHVRVAFLYLQKYPVVEALQRFSASLTSFATAHGKNNLYNETITWAYLLLIRERMARGSTTHTWDEFAQLNPHLLMWKPGIGAKLAAGSSLASWNTRWSRPGRRRRGRP